MATTKGLYTTNRTYVGMLRGTYATGIYVPSVFVADQSFRFNSLLLTGETDYLPFNADNSLNNLNVRVEADAKASNFSPYTGGYYGIYSDNTGVLSGGTTATIAAGVFTFEGWFYLNAVTSHTWLMGLGTNTGGQTPYFDVSLTSSGTNIAVSLTSTVTGVFTFNATYTWPLNRWVHLAAVGNGTTVKVYVNGVGLTTTLASGTFPGSYLNTLSLYPWVVGLLYGGGGARSDGVNGYVSNFRFVNGTAVYTADFTPSTTPLTAISGTAMLACQDNRLVDRSINNASLTKAGVINVTAANPFEVPESFVSYGSTYLDGTGDLLSIPTTTLFAFGTLNFTVEAWIYPLAYGGSTCGASIFGTVNGSTSGYSLNLGQTQDTMRIISNASGSWTDNLTVSAGGGAPLNTWSHIAWVRNGNSMTIYKNGISVGTVSGVSAYNFTSPFNAGYAGFFSDGSNIRHFNGYISDLRVVRGTAIYTGNFTPPSAPISISGSPIQYTLTANVNTSFPAANTALSLLQYSQPHNNSTFLDKSNFRQLIARNGNARQGTFSPYGANWSAYFDGSSYIITASSTAFGFGTGDYTVEFWYYSADDSYSFPWDFRVAGGGAGQTRPLMSISATDTIFYIGQTTLISGTGVPNRTWAHVALVRQSGVTRIYVNGNLTGTPYTGSQDFGSTNTLSLSTVADSPGYDVTELIGNMSNFRVVKGIAVYTGNFTPPTAPLTTTITASANVTAVTSANVSYLGLNSNKLIDSSINNISQTVTGTVTIEKFSPFGLTANASPILTGGSAYFDGTGDYLTSSGSTAFTMGTGPFTVEYWVYQTVNTGTYTQHVGSANGASGWAYGASSVTPYMTSSSQGYVASVAYALHTWNHIAWTRDSSGNVRCFLNGVMIYGPTSITTTITETNFGIGATTGGSYTFTGYLSDIKVVKGMNTYTGNFTPPSAPLSLGGNSTIYSNTANVNTTFAASNATLMLNFTDAAIKDATTYFNLETVADAKLGFETAYSGSYYSNYFDGSGDYLTVPAGANSFPGDFTFEFWLYPTTDGYSAISGDTNNSYLFQRQSGNISVYMSGTDFATGTGAAPTNTWTHIAWVRNGTTSTLYINGVNNASRTLSGTLGSASTMYFGARGDLTYYTTGYISNLRIVKGTAVYTSAFTPPTSPLTAISGTSILTCQSNRFIDNSTNNFAITVNGQTAVRSFNPFQRNTGSSLFFDGSGDYASIVTSPSLNFGTGDFTVEAWVYPSQLSVDWFIISASGSGGFFFGYAPSSGGYGWGRASVAWDYQPATSKTSNAWQHVAVTRSGTSMRLFVNGTQQGTTQTNSTAYNLGTTSTTIGSQGANYYLTGYIDDLRITRGNARYTANFTPSITMLSVR